LAEKRCKSEETRHGKQKHMGQNHNECEDAWEKKKDAGKKELTSKKRQGKDARKRAIPLSL